MTWRQAERARLDDLLRHYRALGWPNVRIAEQLDRSVVWVTERSRVLGLPRRGACFQHYVGWTSEQIALYRLYRRKNYHAAEARAVALGTS